MNLLAGQKDPAMAPTLFTLYLPRHTVTSTTMESLKVTTETIIPTCYKAYMEIFSKGKASGLPSHRLYDCAIDLHPGTTPPQDLPLGYLGTAGHGGICAGSP